MNTTAIVLLIVAGVALLGLGVLALVLFILFIVKTLGGSKGGWTALVEKFSVPQPPFTPGLGSLTVQIGAVVYRRCVALWITPQGLYVNIWRRTILVPWSEFTKVGESLLYWQKVPLVTIGQPPLATMTLPPHVFQELQGRLLPAPLPTTADAQA